MTLNNKESPSSRHSLRGDWIGAEGCWGGTPVLIRLRRFSDHPLACKRWPHVFVLTYAFHARDATGIPSAEQYVSLGEFEARVLDPIDMTELGALALVETGHGRVRYFCYVCDPRAGGEFLNRWLRDDDPVELATAADPEWSEYTKRVARITNNLAM